MFRSGLLRNVTVVLRSLVTHEDEARSFSPHPKFLQLFRQGDTEPPSGQTRRTWTFPLCGGFARRDGVLVGWCPGLKGCVVELGCWGSATAQTAHRAPGCFQQPRCRHNIWLLARGCCQGLHSGSKTKHIFKTKSRVGYSNAPGSEACVLTHTFVRACRVYLKVLLLAL